MPISQITVHGTRHLAGRPSNTSAAVQSEGRMSRMLLPLEKLADHNLYSR